MFAHILKAHSGNCMKIGWKYKKWPIHKIRFISDKVFEFMIWQPIESLLLFHDIEK